MNSHSAAMVTPNDDVRTLKRIRLRAGVTGIGNLDGHTTTAVVVDVETTGLDQETDQVIELAARRFRFDDDGIIIEIGKAWSWREDPGFPIAADITRITGLTDSDLAGQRIDDATAMKVIGGADVVIAHHSAFDRPMIEKRLPDLPGLPWACSMDGIAWREAGFEGQSLGYLCMQAGWWFDAHRAQGDVDAVIQLLQHEGTDGVPLLYELYEHALSDSHLIEAVGAAFEVKDALKARGYRWNPDDGVWWTEVIDRDLLAEQAWLALNVYASSKRPTRHAPRMTQRTAFDRYR